MRKYTRDRYAKLFWSNVELRGLDECWSWQGRSSWSKGLLYGRFVGWRTRRDDYAHRLAYQLSFLLTDTTIPPGMEVHHTCNNTLCVNPRHLELLPESVHKRSCLEGPRLQHGYFYSKQARLARRHV